MPTSLSPVFLCLTLSTALILTLHAQPAHQTLDLLAKEHAPCKIVRPETTSRIEWQAINLLRNALQENGAKIPVITDATESDADATEIVIGQTSRDALAGVTFNRIALGSEGFQIKVIGRRVFILGGGEHGTKKGVQHFLRTFVTEKPADGLTLPADYDYAEPQKYAISDVKIAERSLADFVIIPLADDHEPAALLRDLVFQYTGLWLEIAAQDAPKKPAIVFSSQKPETAGSFELLEQKGDVVLKTDLPGGFVRGLHAFFASIVSHSQGTLAMPETYDFRKTFGTAVLYSDFGACGDGMTDDIEAIIRAHAFANQHDLPVKADQDAKYYIGGTDATVIIQTDTDFGNAEFLIDDTNVENRVPAVFRITSKLASHPLKSVKSLQRGQTNLGVTLPQRSLICATDSNVKRYIRYGVNQNKGAAQTDVFIVEANGDVDPATPILWDFNQITNLTVYPIDTTQLKITGGRFTTKVKADETRFVYYGRGLNVRRSNVLIEGLEHYITNEGDQGSAYSGFINVSLCADVTVRDTILTAHKTFRSKNAAGKPATLGTYDINGNRAVNVSFVNCRQTNDINDRAYWGIMGSNYCKNLMYDGCSFSRFDAHMGVANATIRNSTLGWIGINAIGSGTLLIENTTSNGYSFVNLRSDYGATWEGEIIIRNCVFIPSAGRKVSASLIGGSHNDQHDFGYTCYMPKTITIDGLHIDDRNHPDTYEGPAIFANFNRKNTSDNYVEKYPYVKTEEVILKNVSTASGKPLRTSDNTYMFKDVKIKFVDKD